jgi:hypothetical protein
MVNLQKSKTLPKISALEQPKHPFPWAWIALGIASAIGAGILLAILQR